MTSAVKARRGSTIGHEQTGFERQSELKAVTKLPRLAVSSSVTTSAGAESDGTVLLARLLDFVELTKPRIVLFALLPVAVGYTVGSAGNWQAGPLAFAVLGVGLVACASNVLNQCMECSTDSRMRRTSARPLPSGRMQARDAIAFGLVCAVAGCVSLAVWVNGLTALLAFATLVLYAGVYTPLKRITPMCTVAGAIPGALPPVLGWTAAGGALDGGAFSLFAVLFVWQFPHVLAIGWLYREDYARAGLWMLPARRHSPRVTGLTACCYALALIPVSLLPRAHALAGDGYVLSAMLLGVGYCYFSLRFLLDESARNARRLLWMSLVYLPILLLSLTCDYVQLLS